MAKKPTTSKTRAKAKPPKPINPADVWPRLAAFAKEFRQFAPVEVADELDELLKVLNG
jgi:hypothetical protein